MENWKLLLDGIRNFFTKAVLYITGQVEVINLPEVQRVEIINPQEPTETVEVSNLKDYSDKLDRIIGELSKEEQSADYSEIINALKEVVTTLEIDKTDYSPIILAINNAVKELKQKYPEFDDTNIITAIKELPGFDFEKYLQYGELPVVINSKQIESLVKAFGQQVITATSNGGGILKNEDGNINDTNPLQVSLFDQNANGLDIQTDIFDNRNRLLNYSKIQSGNSSEQDVLYVASEDGTMLAARGAVLLAGVSALSGDIRQRLLQTEVINTKNHLLTKDAYTASIDTNLNRVIGVADDIAASQSIIIGAVVDGKIGNSSGDYCTLNTNKSAVLRVIPSSGTTDVTVAKEASDTLGGTNVMGVAAFQDSTGKAVCPALDSSRRVIVAATSVIPGNTATALGKAEDAAHASGDTGVAIWARRIDTLAQSAGSSGDYSTINEDKDGALYINPESGLWSRSDTYTTATSGTTIDCSHNPKKHFTLQCKGTSTQVGTTTWTINMEVSLDNVNWKTLITHAYPTDTDGDIKTYATSPFPVKYYRSTCSSLTLGTATNVVATILGSN